MRLTSINDITTKHRHIFLSPHFDDAVYSCGGTLGVQVSCGLRPLIITVFGGIPSANITLSPFAMRVHQEMGADNTKGPGNAIELRRKRMLPPSTTWKSITSGLIIWTLSIAVHLPITPVANN